MKIAVCTLDIGVDFSDAVRPAQISKQIYCEKHGYDYIDDQSVYDESRPHAWSKIKLLQKYIPRYDFVVWIDADAMIMDFDQKLEDKISLMEDRDIMVIQPYPRINTGVMFCRNSDFVMNFLQQIYDYDMDVTSGDWEQDAFINLYLSDPNIQKHIKVLDYSYESIIQSYWFVYRYGHFILHFAGYRGQLVSLKKDIKNRCLNSLPEDEEGDLASRTNYMKNGWDSYVKLELSRI
jgi:hypothetical protein